MKPRKNPGFFSKNSQKAQPSVNLKNETLKKTENKRASKENGDSISKMIRHKDHGGRKREEMEERLKT